MPAPSQENTTRFPYATERKQPTDHRLNEAATWAYSAFMGKFTDLDLRAPGVIEQAHQEAIDQGLFLLADQVRHAYYGHDLHTYGVVYISDACREACHFCPAGIWNKNYHTKTLRPQEVILEVLCVMLQGQSRVCILQANWPESAFMRHLRHWLPEVLRICTPLGLQELILNVQTLDSTSYQEIVALRNQTDPHCALQVRTFQETYTEHQFEALIPMVTSGSKWDFAKRRQTQEVAWEAGVDAVGCGVLFGLSPYPIRELASLIGHIEELQQHEARVVRACLPFAHAIDGLRTEIPFDVPTSERSYRLLAELLYALARLAIPEMNWVMSERDPPDIRDSLVHFATETTVGVRPGVGDNFAAYIDASQGVRFQQSTVYSENPAAYHERMNRLGYSLLLDTRPERTAKIREAINALAK